MGKDIWFDEIEDCQASLDLAALSVNKVPKHPSYWKWLIIATHDALQAALVCAVSGTHTTGALTDASAAKMLRYLETSKGGYPKERLADFSTLLRRGQDPKRTNNYTPLKLRASERTDLDKLHALLRNEFVHFTPKGWTIEVSGMPRILRTATEATEHLLTQVVATAPGNRKNRVDTAFKVIFEGLAKLELN